MLLNRVLNIHRGQLYIMRNYLKWVQQIDYYDHMSPVTIIETTFRTSSGWTTSQNKLLTSFVFFKVSYGGYLF
jgi:hypothetical protein